MGQEEDEQVRLLVGEAEHGSGGQERISERTGCTCHDGVCRHLAAIINQAVWGSGAACMSIAAIVFSLSALLVKLTGDRVPTFQIVTVRSSLSFIACAWGARAAHMPRLFGRREHFPTLLARGLFGAAAMTTYYLSIACLPLPDAVTLFFLNPAATALAAWVFLHEPLGAVGLAGVAVSVAGLVLQAHPPFLFDADGTEWDQRRVAGTGFGLLSALFAAGAFIAIRFIGHGEPALVMSVWFHVCGFTSSALPLAAGVPMPAVLPDARDCALLFGVAATSFWGQILIGRGIQLLPAAQASAINVTQVLYSYALGVLLLGDPLTWLGVSGSALIILGVVMVNVRQGEPPQPQLLGTDAQMAVVAVKPAAAAGGQDGGAPASEAARTLEMGPLPNSMPASPSTIQATATQPLREGEEHGSSFEDRGTGAGGIKE